jgi:hypothetical protein
MTVLIGATVLASHGLATLTGSNFEIDDSANLKVDHLGPPALVDWASLANPIDLSGPEVRAIDAPTGQNDDSYKGGVKEDTACPDETTGSIPNNKSDLLTLHVYEEPGVGTHPGFLNLAWGRVSDPSGTTLMDFEFNQSESDCTVGPNKVRTVDDLLIEYAIDQGGARANITGRLWTGTAWGPAQNLSANNPLCGGGPCAVGTISSSAIPAAESDGLGAKQARTFGEAQIDLRLIFQSDECVSFGSAMLKSRSSDAFTSQLKDFIAPVPINLQNCGNVIIRKQTDPDEDPNTTSFGYTKSFGTDPASANTFTLTDDGVQDYNDTVLFGSGYTVVEDVLPTGWDFVNVDCSASSGVTPVINGAQVTFAIDSDADVLDCTYNNEARGSIIIEKVTTGGFGAFDFGSDADLPSPAVNGDFSLTTTAAGAAGKDSKTFSNLVAGTVYDVTESIPAGWDLTNIACSGGTFTVGTDGNADFDAGDTKATITVPSGATVTCTYTNTREFVIIVITCNEQTNGLVDSTVTLSGADTQTITAVPTALANKGVTAADLCAIGGARYGDLAQGTYAASVEVPDLAPLFTPN